jgi:predicted glycosyltransferase
VTRPPLLFYCQHSLGLGHLSRAFALGEALARVFDVVLLCGGKLPPAIKPPEGVRVVALSPIGAGIDGRLISHDWGVSLERARALRLGTIPRHFSLAATGGDRHRVLSVRQEEVRG